MEEPVWQEEPLTGRRSIGSWFARLLALLCLGIILGFVGWQVYGEIRHAMPNQSEELAPLKVRDEHPVGPVDTHYGYGTLSAEDRELYDIAYDALVTASKRSFPTDDREAIQRIERIVLADHPELADYTALVICEGSMFAPAYVAGVPLMDDESASVLADSIEAAKQDCLGTIPGDADDYGKAKAVYDWLVSNISYDDAAAETPGDIIINAKGDDTYSLEPGSSLPAEHGQTIGNALVEKEAVCAGYARAYQYLLQCLGIPCVYVSGTANGGSHAWCAALLDGDYYLIDPTWGDPEYMGVDGEDPIVQDAVDHRFFCVDDASMSISHSPDGTLELPSCTSLQDNYFVREGLYFDQPDDDRFASLWQRAVEEGTMLTIRCADQGTRDAIMATWIESGEAGRFTADGRFRYTTDDLGLFTIGLWPH